MTDHIIISGYGIPQMTKEEKDAFLLKCFNYLKARIEAEKLNPQRDYDGKTEFNLLKKIALSDCNLFQRIDLVKLLLDYNNDED